MFFRELNEEDQILEVIVAHALDFCRWDIMNELDNNFTTKENSLDMSMSMVIDMVKYKPLGQLVCEIIGS